MSDKRQMASVYVPRPLHEKSKALARELGLSWSALVNLLLWERIEGNRKKQGK
jgi:hypothetical protein